MPGLPPDALQVLETAAERFSEKPFKATITRKLSVPDVRRAMGTAARASGPDQSPAVLYDPGHADALVVLRAEDLAAVLSEASRGGHVPHDGG
jgi:hypothetical protein